MNSKPRIPTHPGLVLIAEFLRPMKITQARLAERTRMPPDRVNALVRGRRGITADTAWRLSKALKTTPEFWMNLQTAYDLAVARTDERIAPLP